MLVVFGAIIFLLAGVALSLPRSFKPEVRCTQGPTASKAQSKLWFNDGVWWGILFDGFSEEYHIYRYDQAEDAWKDTGVLVDARNTSRADALWEDGHLYVVSAGTEASLDKDGARFLRYSYDPVDRPLLARQRFSGNHNRGRYGGHHGSQGHHRHALGHLYPRRRVAPRLRNPYFG